MPRVLKSRIYLLTLVLHDFCCCISSLSRLLSTASPQCFAILLNSFNRSAKYNKIEKPHAADCSDRHIDWEAAQKEGVEEVEERLLSY